jgi:hypothetical protein
VHSFAKKAGSSLNFVINKLFGSKKKEETENEQTLEDSDKK